VCHSYSLIAGRLYTPTRRLENAFIQVENHRVTTVEANSHQRQATYDFSDAIVIPGLVDLQVNGALGFSFQADHRRHFNDIFAYHNAHGTTSFLPTLITAAPETLVESLEVLSQYLAGLTSFYPGIHLEGPFLSPEKSGAHDPQSLCLPDLSLALRYLDAARGMIRILTLAPELPGAFSVIHEMHQRGVIISAGHTAATYDQLKEAIQHGLSFVTHAGNASDWPHRKVGELGFLASEPGLVGTLISEEDLAGSVIMDSFHFHPALLAPVLKLKGPNRLLLVSDASTVAGCPPGEYQSGGLVVTIHPEGFATSGRGGGWLAGSTITLLDAVVRSVQLGGISLQQAVHMATLGPARRIGIAQNKGHLEPGADADLVVLNQDLSLRTVLSHPSTTS